MGPERSRLVYMWLAAAGRFLAYVSLNWQASADMYF